MKIASIVGARPNFMKVAPLMHAMAGRKGFDSVLVHTGQHYDFQMSGIFAPELGLPEPHSHLAVGSGSPIWQTAQIMLRFETVLQEIEPDIVMVVGDVNSTLACSLVAAQVGIPIAHVESGLRSFDRTMPEEINRLTIDHLSDYLFTTCPEADENLLREGIEAERIFLVGNVMIDSLFTHLPEAQRSDILDRLGLQQGSYAVLTLHRPSNVDDLKTFEKILSCLETIQQEIAIVFPAHPRTRQRISQFALCERIARMDNFHVVEPLGYIEFLALMSKSKFVLSDSGGIQDETTALGIPCLTLRENTERPNTLTVGTNTLVGADFDLVVGEAQKIISGSGKTGSVPDLWDGSTAERITGILEKVMPQRNPPPKEYNL